MDFTFNEEERQFAESVRRYSLQRLLPDFQKWDHGNAFPRERVRELGPLGITGPSVPAVYGGSEGTFSMAGIAADVIGLKIGDGTLELMKFIIARETFGRDFLAYR